MFIYPTPTPPLTRGRSDLLIFPPDQIQWGRAGLEPATLLYFLWFWVWVWVGEINFRHGVGRSGAGGVVTAQAERGRAVT